jgi:hypothetical protein
MVGCGLLIRGAAGTMSFDLSKAKSSRVHQPA